MVVPSVSGENTINKNLSVICIFSERSERAVNAKFLYQPKGANNIE
jgi:hypothetical protein